MRTAILIAALATGLIMPACNWFSSAKPEQQSLSVEGDWQLDSIQLGGDTSKYVGWLLFTTLKPTDSHQPITVHFNKGTLISTFGSPDNDTVSYTFIDNKLNIGSDSVDTFSHLLPHLILCCY